MRAYRLFEIDTNQILFKYLGRNPRKEMIEVGVEMTFEVNQDTMLVARLGIPQKDEEEALSFLEALREVDASFIYETKIKTVVEQVIANFKNGEGTGLMYGIEIGTFISSSFTIYDRV